MAKNIKNGNKKSSVNDAFEGAKAALPIFIDEYTKECDRKNVIESKITTLLTEYYGAAEPPVRCGESHLSGLMEPPHFVY